MARRARVGQVPRGGAAREAADRVERAREISRLSGECACVVVECVCVRACVCVVKCVRACPYVCVSVCGI